jgi:hypothetical protein
MNKFIVQRLDPKTGRLITEFDKQAMDFAQVADSFKHAAETFREHVSNINIASKALAAALKLNSVETLGANTCADRMTITVSYPYIRDEKTCWKPAVQPYYRRSRW